MADPDSSLTPEQRLLKLIEEEEKGAGDAPVKTAKRPVDLREFLSPEAIRGRLTTGWGSLLATFKQQKSQIRLGKVNHVLKLLLSGMGIVLLIAIFYDMRLLGIDYEKKLSIPRSTASEMTVTEEAELGLSFMDGLGTRNVFAPFQARAEEQPVTNAMTLKILEMTENLRLTGISVHPTDARKNFVMLEDLEKDITTFLKVGDSISGLKVDEIRPDTVVLRYRDETVEIR